MFKPKTDRIELLEKLFPKPVAELDAIFDAPTNVYIDWQNVLHWSGKLGWHVDVTRLKQFLDSFSNIDCVRLYTGTMVGNQLSEDEMKKLGSQRYDIVTKPVKKMFFSIDTSSVPSNSPTLLESFIKPTLLSRLNVRTIEYLNSQLEDLNKQGIYKLEDLKCNFDVEIGRDMFLDLERGVTERFILWSGDSDFVDPANAITAAEKRIFIFATSGRVSKELADLGIPIFEIMKIREFVCRKAELPAAVKTKLGI